jgi:hypothetical protein
MVTKEVAASKYRENVKSQKAHISGDPEESPHTHVLLYRLEIFWEL